MPHFDDYLTNVIEKSVRKMSQQAEQASPEHRFNFESPS